MVCVDARRQKIASYALLITSEAVACGMDVTAFVRGENKSAEHMASLAAGTPLETGEAIITSAYNLPIAFCYISTGLFHFPSNEAAKVAIGAVRDFMRGTMHCSFDSALTDRSSHPNIKVVFNVFKEEDYAIYKRLLE